MPELRLIAANADVSASLPEVAFDPEVQQTRPGLAHQPLAVTLQAELAEAAHAAATKESCPLALWIVVVVESERVLRLLEVEAAMVTELDKAAATSQVRVVDRASRSRLSAYANALRKRALGSTSGARREVSRKSAELILPVPYHTATAWSRAAIRAQEPVETWLEKLLEPLPAGRQLWEAAAAEQGATLAEWIAIQAALRCRS